MTRKILTLAVILAFSAVTAPALEVPYLAGRVNDLADLLSPGAEARIEEQLAELESETGAQGAVLTVPSLEGDPLEDFSLRVVETWKLGREGADDGVLLLIAREERQVRIEVGYGLEATLTDIGSKRILSDVMTPRFREGDFDGGVEAAVGAIAGTVRGQEDAIPLASSGVSDPAPLGLLLAFGGLFVFVIGLFSFVAAASTGFAAWLLYFFLMPFYFLFPTAALGLIAGLTALGAWIVAFPILHHFLKGTDIARHFGSGRGRGGTWSRGGWSRGGFGGFGGGGFGGGGFSGGGFSGGGFSGGGGSFGGGGASGSW